MKRLSPFKLVFLILGFALLFYLFQSLGIARVAGRIHQMGWGFVVILLFPMAIQQVLFVLGWKFAFSGTSSRFQNLLEIHLFGEAFNYITPGGQMGGEPLKALSLRRDMDGVQAMISVIAAKTSKAISLAVFILAGLLLTINAYPFPREFKDAVMAAVCLFSAVGVIFLLAQRRGLFGPVMRFAESRLGLVPARYKGKIGRFDDLDAGLKEFYSNRKFRFSLSIFCCILGWLAGFLEMYMILLLLGVKATLPMALIIEALSLIINAALFFVPGGVGTQEGGKVLICKLMALEPATGLALGVVRRLRELAWVFLGLLIYAFRPVGGEQGS